MPTGSIRWIRSPIILALDLLLIISTFSLVYYLRLDVWPSYRSVDLWLITLTLTTTLFLFGTYGRQPGPKAPQIPVRTFWICLGGGAVCVLWLYLLGPSKFNEYFGRGILPFATVVFGAAATLNRFFINRLYHHQETGSELLYLGFSRSGEKFLAELDKHAEVRSVTVAAVQPREAIASSRVNFTSTPIETLLEESRWRTVIIDPLHVSDDSQTSLLLATRMRGTPIFSLADFYEKFWYMVPVNDIDDDWFLRSQGFSMLENLIARRVKSLIDLTLSAILLVASAPIILLCGAAIKLTSRGPVFFRQTRIGLNGKPFTIYKLRTMRDNAEANGAQWAQTDDPRVTWFGNWLRKSRLDELPQCWNVLHGHMSFVGPRPERPEFTQELAEIIPYYELRHLVKPGISGWAQVLFPYGASVEDSIYKLQYELYYIKNQSLLLDLNIMLRTLLTVFQRAGR